MPLGKYYCDYCDKQFQDTPGARKRHLQGIQHLRAKALWYDSFKLQDPERSGKGVCNRFVKTGFCQYGDSCKYFHPKNLSYVNPQQGGGLFDNTKSAMTMGNPAPAPGNVGMSWGNLPPSLKPPPDGGYLPLPFVDWG
ncbi:hypothetical protein L6164_010418 [Bauhinia variegata]|uniref:Uncharacterized protein n=1 Tax=Bauhinia variegata TaxID=167791 RepID=A0ACB9PM83_BAUVA|nr:hypothetical protein L6164_010418 [Bauhinia variegata]